jgi:glycosyltransferase involved in cell wall biosynthesis
MSPLPKILVVTQFGPNASGGGPAVIRQALKECDPVRVGWWSCHPEESPVFGFRAGWEAGFPIPGKLYPYKRAVAAKGWLLEHLWSPLARANLARTIQAWQPDLLWVIPHMWSIFPVSSFLRGHRGKLPYHVSMHDYMDMSANVPILGRARGKRLATLACELYAQADSQDAISPGMLEDLQRVTGRAGSQILHLGLEPEDFDYIRTPAESAQKVVRVAYAGTIQVPDVFRSVVDVFAQINARGGTPRVVIDFFGSHSYAGQSWFRPEWMHEHGNKDEQDLRLALRECSIGFAPMNLHDDDRYNRFSFPSKITSYLAAGLPVLAVGHPASSAVRMAREYDTGWCWENPDLRGMAEPLSAWLDSANLKARHAPNIMACARAHFDAAQMRSRLYNCFQNSVRPLRT